MLRKRNITGIFEVFQYERVFRGALFILWNFQAYFKSELIFFFDNNNKMKKKNNNNNSNNSILII